VSEPCDAARMFTNGKAGPWFEGKRVAGELPPQGTEFCALPKGHSEDHQPACDVTELARVGKYGAWRVVYARDKSFWPNGKTEISIGTTSFYMNELRACSDAELNEIRVLLDQLSFERAVMKEFEPQMLRDELERLASDASTAAYRWCQERAYVEVRVHPRLICHMLRNTDRNTWPISTIETHSPFVTIREFSQEEMKRHG
jgi:hypothetical protein